jgi:hypothetical protein
MRFKLWHAELILIVMFLLGAAVAITNPLPQKLEYVPDAVKGLTTLLATLVGFTGVCLGFLYSSRKSAEIDSVVRPRVKIIISILAMTIGFASFAFTSLVTGDLFWSYKAAYVSFGLASFCFLETVILLTFKVE